jgi:L-fuculose-phosphate aldolase
MQDQELQVQIAWACRILARQGHTDFTLGHVSGRGAGDIIYMKRNGLGLNEVSPDDVLTIDLNGRKLAGQGNVHLEAVLHTEVYKVRSDVGAVIHTHPPYAVALGATTAHLEFLNHDAVLFHDGVAVFDDTVELITSAGQGQAVAAALGSHRAVLLRNHGVLVVGKDVPWAVITALTLERAVQIQSIAESLGPLQPFAQETAK